MKIKTNSIYAFLREDNIVETHPIPGFKQSETLEMARENVNALRKIAGNRRVGLLNFVSGNYITREAREYYRNKQSFAIASALVAKTLPQKMAGNFIISVQEPVLPIKAFECEREAELWLKNQMQNS